jgi:hypothetical protein
MDLPELARAELGKLKAAAVKEKAWFATNRAEVIAIVCITLAVGLMAGFLIGYLAK